MQTTASLAVNVVYAVNVLQCSEQVGHAGRKKKRKQSISTRSTGCRVNWTWLFGCEHLLDVAPRLIIAVLKGTHLQYVHTQMPQASIMTHLLLPIPYLKENTY